MNEHFSVNNNQESLLHFCTCNISGLNRISVKDFSISVYTVLAFVLFLDNLKIGYIYCKAYSLTLSCKKQLIIDIPLLQIWHWKGRSEVWHNMCLFRWLGAWNRRSQLGHWKRSGRPPYGFSKKLRKLKIKLISYH